ncbi:hypothetical protein GYMLUDRAFT_74954 [Collybiopsis luxurians FD-317 M1]|uniref:Unplaced genomic scaffold GYMLUscaffold_38, whole genome shotgun sequence n=1 Tax=Collybiopsis luxurians FD-317 M1 TaxID=944289 RepID=A0A0D0BS70_9AGAR|nr:hypothetical protein GYMLUDRAFT_74954 [Collybiopsis luxurians FD-317 M1]
MNSFFDINATEYASRKKELLLLVTRLRAVGAQSEIDLPQIVVIGNQSAGKSSLVEAISGITVPRDPQTCTQCPFECRLSSSHNSWSCRISIRTEFNSTGKRLAAVSERRFGECITDKSQVKLFLRRAQFAVLNPDTSWNKILSASAEDLRTWSAQSTSSPSFSRNVICVDVEGPDLTELSFVDLPGLIHNAEPESVQLTEDMVTSYISTKCIILVAVPMTDDIENQKAFRLARQEDPDGHRTIGVLTKPDMITNGSKKVLQNWLDVIEGRQHRLAHGYFCTRQPDDDERATHLTRESQREREETFFTITMPWCQSNARERLGTQNLVNALSYFLMDTIQSSLPQIIKETEEQLELCQKELARIAAPLKEEPTTFLLSQIARFCSDFQVAVQGSIEVPLIQSHRAIYKTFKYDIQQTAPKFIPITDDEEAGPCMNADEEDEEEPGTFRATRLSMNLSDVREHIARSVTRELPDNVPFSATVALIRDFQISWPQYIDKCFEAVRAATLAALQDKANHVFGRSGALQIHLRSLISKIVENHQTACTSILSKIVEIELIPFTQNTDYLQSNTERWLAKYKSTRSARNAADATTNDTGNRAPPKLVGLRFPASDFKSTKYHSNLLASLPDGHYPIFKPISDGPSSETTMCCISASVDSPFSKFSLEEIRFRAYSAGRPHQPGIPSQPTAAPLGNDHERSTRFAGSFGTHNPNSFATEDNDLFRTILDKLAEAGLPVSSKEELLSKLKPSKDEYETELKLMAEVSSYAEIAHQRIIDYVPSFIDLMFVRAIAQELQMFLVSKLELDTPKGRELCARLLEEDPNIVIQRNEVLSRKGVLKNVRRKLTMFSMHRTIS